MSQPARIAPRRRRVQQRRHPLAAAPRHRKRPPGKGGADAATAAATSSASTPHAGLREDAPPPERDVLWRLLVVDDEPAMRLLCRANLPFAGFEVVEAPDGEVALELARKQEFDLFVLDVMMPAMSGFQVAERLRADERTANAPIVFLSARADQADIQRGLQLGAADYVTKPFDPLALGDRLRALLDAHGRDEETS